MTVNRTTLLDLPLPVTGTESGTWGDTTNNGLTQYVDIAIAGMSNLTSANFTAGALTIETTEGDSSATNISATSAQYAGFRVTSLAANSTITVGNTGTSPARSYRLINADATYNLTFKATGQTGVTLLPGQSALVAFNGTDYVIVGTVGAGSTTDNTVPRFDGTTGKILQSSGITIDDSNNVSGVAQLNITTLDATNIEVTNIKAKDGTAAASIADSTGVISVTANPVLSGGTANGVAYLNGSKVLTTGSALSFDGTNLASTTLSLAGSAAPTTANNERIAISNSYDATVQARYYGAPATNQKYLNVGWNVQTYGSGGSGYIVNGTNGIYSLPSGGQFISSADYTAFGALSANGFTNTGPTFSEYMRLTSTGLKSSIAGTNADPVFSYTSDTNTGIFFPAADKLGFTAGGGTDQMVLTTTGLGIGTSSPGYKLDVNTVGGSTATARLYGNDQANVRLRLENVGTSGNTWELVGGSPGTNNSSFAIYDATAAATRLLIDTSGNLGLGVTPSAWGSGYSGLQLGLGLSLMGSSVNGNFAANCYFDGTNWRYVQNTFANNFYVNYANNGSFVWATAPSGTAGNAITFSQAMTLDASGNLGVGDTSPNARVSIRLDGTGAYAEALWKNTNSTAQLAIGVAGSAVGVAAIQNNAYLYNTGNSAMVFGTNNTERARITSGGYFKASNDGTYVNSTGTFHELSGDGTAETLIVDNTISASAALIVHTRGAANFAGKHYIAENFGTTVFEVAANGNVTNTNGSYGTISDQKLKQDIVDAGSQWADIKAIRFRKYRMKADVAANPDAPALLGVVAQELEQTSPGLVDESPDRDADGNDLGTTTKSVKTSVLLMKAAVALQEAMARIETLEAKVSALEGN